MNPRDRKARDLLAVAAAVISTAAACDTPAGSCTARWTLPGGTICCARHIDGCPELTTEQVDHTYATGTRGQGLHREDHGTHSLVGGNGRRIIVREDADGLYVGGVLLTSHSAVRDLSDLLSDLATGMWARDGRE